MADFPIFRVIENPPKNAKIRVQHPIFTKNEKNTGSFVYAIVKYKFWKHLHLV